MKEEDYDKLLEEYYKSTYKKKTAILEEAICYMQQYNGRSIRDCIVMAMGGDYKDS